MTLSFAVPALALTSDIAKYLRLKAPSAKMTAIADAAEFEQCLIRHMSRLSGASAMVYRENGLVTVAMVKTFVLGSATFDPRTNPVIAEVRSKPGRMATRQCSRDEMREGAGQR
jgi:hypothetical protein